MEKWVQRIDANDRQLYIRMKASAKPENVENFAKKALGISEIVEIFRTKVPKGIFDPEKTGWMEVWVVRF